MIELPIEDFELIAITIIKDISVRFYCYPQKNTKFNNNLEIVGRKEIKRLSVLDNWIARFTLLKIRERSLVFCKYSLHYCVLCIIRARNKT